MEKTAVCVCVFPSKIWTMWAIFEEDIWLLLVVSRSQTQTSSFTAVSKNMRRTWEIVRQGYVSATHIVTPK
jgi:hypothetical protein